MTKIKVLIVDDHDLVVMGMEKLLSEREDIEVVAIARDGEEALEKTRIFQPDVVILDIQIPKISGIKVTEEITAKYPDTRVLLHSSFTDEKYIIQGFDYGAAGYVPKNFKPDQLLEAVVTVSEGKHYMKDFVSEVYISHYQDNAKKNLIKSKQQQVDLTARELEILKLVAMGHTNQNISELLFISIRTVEVHKSNIMKKVSVHNIAELVVYAIKNDIIEI